jgi:sugar phosphate isomerase/epimerase
MKLATYARIFEFGSSTAEQVRLHEFTRFRYLDLSFFRAMSPGQPGSFLLEDDWKNEINEAAESAKKLGISFIQIHTPFGNPLENDDEYISAYISCITRSLEACSMLGSKNAVIHAGSKPSAEKEEIFDKNKTFLKKLFPVIEYYNVNLLIENVMSCKIDPVSFRLTRGADLKEFIDYLDHPLIHALWDTGHAHVQGLAQHDEIMAIGEHLLGLHIASNNSHADDHLPPLISEIDMDSIMPALIAINYPGYFTFEVTPISFARAMSKHAKLLYGDPLYTQVCKLCVKGTALMYDIGKCILTAYGCYEN